MVPGARAVRSGFGAVEGLSLQTPVIVKYRDDKTDVAVLRVVVPGGERPHGGEPPDRQRGDHRFGASCDHRVRVAAPRSALVIVSAHEDSRIIGGATALGPVVQGLRRPCSDLSRGATVEDIVLITAIAALQAEDG